MDSLDVLKKRAVKNILKTCLELKNIGGVDILDDLFFDLCKSNEFIEDAICNAAKDIEHENIELCKTLLNKNNEQNI